MEAWHSNSLDSELVQGLESYEDNITRDVDHWIDHIIEGFMI